MYNEMYWDLLSDQTISIRKSDRSDSFQELCTYMYNVFGVKFVFNIIMMINL